MKTERIGIFGGTFSPPHMGHYYAAKAFLEKLKLDKLLIIPSYIPPHKTVSEATAEQRLQMCKLAFADLNVQISDIEISRGGTSYTYLTLEELSRPNREIYLLCGTDMFLTIDKWRNPEKLFALSTICYVRRETDANKTEQLLAKEKELKDRFGALVVSIDNDVLEISSTELRRRIKGQGDLDEVLSASVLNYIKSEGLYL